MADLYKYAAQNKLRFPSNRGALLLEQLFDLPLTSKTDFDLNNVAKEVNVNLKACSEESFVSIKSNPQQKELELMLDLVKDVIATKQAENAEALTRQHRSEERRKLLDAIAAKKDQVLSQASLDELEKKLAELDPV